MAANADEPVEITYRRQHIAELIRRFDPPATPPHPGEERRSNVRYRLNIPLRATPVDDMHHPVASTFESVTVDLSESGCRFMHTEPVTSPLLLIEFRPQGTAPVRVVLGLLRSTPQGDGFELAGRFLFLPENVIAR